MTAEERALWEKIEQYPLDKPGVSFPFSAKLAKENEWSAAYGRRTIEEYRRFVFLSCVGGHPVSPSHDVDEVWHLHILYTEDYGRFCSDVLGRPFHHYPSSGGQSESAKFDDWYARTLTSYRNYFGEQPPIDIWPAPGSQFRKKQNYWRVPKPPVRLLSLLLGPAVIVGCAATGGNPLDYTGPDFLVFYVWLQIGLWAVAALLRFSLRLPAPSAPLPMLTAEEAAYLAGGASHTNQVAVAGLSSRRLIGSAHGFRIDPTALPATGCTQTESDMLNRIQSLGVVQGTAVARLRLPSWLRIESDLTSKGLLVPPDRRQAALFVPLMIAMIGPAIGAVKVAIGISRDRPVEFLVMLSIVSFVINLAAFARRPHRSRHGDAALAAMRSHYGYLTSRSGQTVNPQTDELMLAVALFGLPALEGSPQAHLRSILAPQSSGGGSGCSSGGCSSASSCGSGGGCSSGGGGGCGGCGGGGQ